MSSYHLDHLQYLETEAIHIMREVAAEFERPALLFSGGKDSICLLRLAEKAFRPSDIPMPFLNVDTGHHFPELNEFREMMARVHIEERHRDVRGTEGFLGQAQEADGILAAGEQQRRPLKLRGDLAHDVDGFGFEVLKMIE